MRKEEIPDYFLNKTINLIKADGFILTGVILKVNETNILFATQQATSLISLDNIREIVLPRER